MVARKRARAGEDVAPIAPLGADPRRIVKPPNPSWGYRTWPMMVLAYSSDQPAPSFESDGAVATGIMQDVQCKLSQDGEVFWLVAPPVACAIFFGVDIERPMEAVFDRPMRPDRLSQAHGVHLRRGEVKQVRGARPAVAGHNSFDHPDLSTTGHCGFVGVASAGQHPAARSKERRSVLPSTATTFGPSLCGASRTCAKQPTKVAGFSGQNSRE